MQLIFIVVTEINVDRYFDYREYMYFDFFVSRYYNIICGSTLTAIVRCTVLIAYIIPASHDLTVHRE